MAERKSGFYFVQMDGAGEVAWYGGFGLWYFKGHYRPIDDSKIFWKGDIPLFDGIFERFHDQFKKDAKAIIEHYKAENPESKELLDKILLEIQKIPFPE